MRHARHSKLTQLASGLLLVLLVTADELENPLGGAHLLTYLLAAGGFALFGGRALVAVLPGFPSRTVGDRGLLSGMTAALALLVGVMAPVALGTTGAVLGLLTGLLLAVFLTALAELGAPRALDSPAGAGRRALGLGLAAAGALVVGLDVTLALATSRVPLVAFGALLLAVLALLTRGGHDPRAGLGLVPTRALWDVFFTVAFGLLLLDAAFTLYPVSPLAATLPATAFEVLVGATGVGLLAGLLGVPVLRWLLGDPLVCGGPFSPARFPLRLPHLLGGAAFLAVLAVAEWDLPGDDHPVLFYGVAAVGFGAFLARTLLEVRPWGPRLQARGPWTVGMVAAAVVAVTLTPWGTATLGYVLLVGLLLFGGYLVAEFFDEVAEAAAAPVPELRKGGLGIVTVLLVAEVVTVVAAFGYLGPLLADGERFYAALLEGAATGLAVAVAATAVLLVAALLGKGRSSLVRRAVHAPLFLVPLAVFHTYSVEQALALDAAVVVPLTAVGILVMEVFELLHAAPTRLAASRRIREAALWDVLLLLLFGVALTAAIHGRIGEGLTGHAVLVEGLVSLGILVGVLVVPLRHLLRREPAARRLAALFPAPRPLPLNTVTAAVSAVATGCPLCDNVPKEPWLHEEGEYVIVAAKNLKGHAFRIMIASKNHVHPKTLPAEYEERGLRLVADFARKHFGLEKGFAVYRDRYSSIPDHWHMICADLQPGEDLAQVIDTPRVMFTPKHPEGLEIEPGRPYPLL